MWRKCESLSANVCSTAVEALSIVVLVTAAVSSRATENERNGVVVEWVAKGSACEQAGLVPGDRLFHWELAGATGDIRTAFDWRWVQSEQGPRGPVKISAERGAEICTFEVPRGIWGIEVRPAMSGPLPGMYEEGKRAVEAQSIDKGVGAWRKIASDAEAVGDLSLACWIELQIGTALDSAGPGGLASAMSLSNLGEVAADRKDMLSAESYYRRALAIREKHASGSLEEATSLCKMGEVSRERGSLAAAETYYKRALSIRAKLAPGSMFEAEAQHALANS